MKNKFLKYTGLGFLFSRPKKAYRYGKAKVNKSLRLQLVLTFGICTLAFTIVSGITKPMLDNWDRNARIDYSNSRYVIESTARNLAHEIDNWERDLNQTYNVQNLISQYEDNIPSMKILIADRDGKVINKSKNATEEKVDLHTINRQLSEERLNERRNTGEEYWTLYPTLVHQKPVYLIVSGIPQANIIYEEDGEFLSILAGMAAFLGLFFYLTRRKMHRIEEVSSGLLEISTGNLDFRVDEHGDDELASLARNINIMAEELQIKIETERQAERTKNELITNVSHDLRTPLTSIMGYLRLLKDDNNIDEQKRHDYIQIAFNKSEKLKGLIEDLFEYTKISGDGHKLHKERVCLNEMIDQLIEEWVAGAEDSDVVLKKELPSERINVYIDPDKMARVFENLLSNAIKYSLKPGEVYVKMNASDASVTITVENKGEPIRQEDLSRLFERFYKVEQSRTSASEGSGLGLAIARSIVDLHDGAIWAESEGEQIRFLLKLNRV